MLACNVGAKCQLFLRISALRSVATWSIICFCLCEQHFFVSTVPILQSLSVPLHLSSVSLLSQLRVSSSGSMAICQHMCTTWYIPYMPRVGDSRLAAVGCWWLVLVGGGCGWSVAGCFWAVLAAVGCCLWLMVVVGCCLLGGAGWWWSVASWSAGGCCGWCWMLMGDGRCWWVVLAAVCGWCQLLGLVVGCWMLLITVGACLMLVCW